jgi:hypothetical protein
MRLIWLIAPSFYEAAHVLERPDSGVIIEL